MNYDFRFTIPATLTAGAYYYFCEVSAAGAETKRTDAATVTVNAPTPVITFTTHPAANTSFTVGSISGSLSAKATVTDGSTPAYLWYSNTVNSSTAGSPTALSAFTGETFAIPAGLGTGTYYYFCEASAAGAEPVRSNVATVVVEGLPVAGQFSAGGIYYKAITAGSTDVKVTNSGYVDALTAPNSYSGAVTVPATVVYEGVTYTVKRIGVGAFYNCASLTSVTLPVGIEQLENSAFNGCTALEAVTLPASGLTVIGWSAFAGCSKLPSLTLPEGLQTIGQNAFYECHELAALHIPASVTVIERNAFGRCYILSVTAAAGGAFSVDAEGVLYESGNILRWIPLAKTGEYVIRAETVTIGEIAISESKLTKISIPASITNINSNNFGSCSSLTDIVAGWSNPAECTTSTYSFNYTTKSNITLWIPAGTSGAYAGHAVWGSGFKAIVETP